MYMGWDINGLADIYHMIILFAAVLVLIMEKLPDKKRSEVVC